MSSRRLTVGDGLIETGATYRDRALSGIVSESGLAQKRELASAAFKEQEIGGILSTTEKGIMTAISEVAGAFHAMGLFPKKPSGGDQQDDTWSAYHTPMTPQSEEGEYQY